MWAFFGNVQLSTRVFKLEESSKVVNLDALSESKVTHSGC